MRADDIDVNGPIGTWDRPLHVLVVAAGVIPSTYIRILEPFEILRRQGLIEPLVVTPDRILAPEPIQTSLPITTSPFEAGTVAPTAPGHSES